jgi:hypothetical protein
MGNGNMKEDIPVRSRKESLGLRGYKSIEFSLIGKKGMVYLRFGKNLDKYLLKHLTYHAIRRQYSGQASFLKCVHLMEKECYWKEYLRSSEEFIELNARARSGGEERLWRYMEEIYENLI